MYCCANKTTTLTSIQHTVPPQFKEAIDVPVQSSAGGRFESLNGQKVIKG